MDYWLLGIAVVMVVGTGVIQWIELIGRWRR